MTNALRVCSVLLLAVGCFSCSTYENVTGYFNTYYNASKIYDDAVADVEHAPQKDRDTNYFAAPVVPPATAAKFDKVIEKCSKLIQFYPNSSWVQDGILMIAKSYVYKGEYEPAFRKFTELIANFPSSGTRFEARLWYARAKYNAKNADEALVLVKELFPEARAEGKDDIMLESLLLEAQIYFDRAEYDQAAATYVLASEVSGDAAKRAWAQYQLGMCYEKMNETTKAALAYGRVSEFGPDFSLEFRARLKHGKMLADGGHHDEAIAKLEDLLGDQLTPDQFALADLEIANTYWDMGDSAQAFALYSFIDTTYRRSDAAAKSYYRQGLIFEHHFADFDKAKVFYLAAKTENPLSEITAKASTKADNFTTYFATRRSMRNYDSLLTRALTPDSLLGRLDSLNRVSDSVAHARDVALGKIIVNPNASISWHDAAPPEQTPDSTADTVAAAPTPIKPFPSRAGLTNRRAKPAAESNDMRSRRAHLDDTADEPEEEPFAKAEPGKRDSTKKALGASKAVAPAVLTPDSLRTLATRSRFELASLFFLQLDYPDSALYWFNEVLHKDSASVLAPKALYAMAEVYRTKGDSAAIDSLYAIILKEHPGTEIALQVQKVKGMRIEAAPVDPAELHYAAAESLLQAGNTRAAVTLFKQIAKQPSSSGLVPKATYSVGWIYENILLNADSATAWYHQLLKNYPGSVYAVEAQPRVAVKDDPKSIEKYLKVKKIDAVAKPVKPGARRLPPADRTPLPEEELKDPADEPDQDEDAPDPEDDSDDSDDGGGTSLLQMMYFQVP